MPCTSRMQLAVPGMQRPVDLREAMLPGIEMVGDRASRLPSLHPGLYIHTQYWREREDEHWQLGLMRISP